jgi:hypothetical protein
MGYNIEAKNGEIPTPYSERVATFRGLLSATNGRLGAMASRHLPQLDFDDRHALADEIRNDRIAHHADFLTQRKTGFARVHTELAILKGLLLASTLNRPDPQEVYPPSETVFSGSRIIFLDERHDSKYDATLDAHREGIVTILDALSDPYVGRLQRDPWLEMGTSIPLFDFPNGLMLTEGITRVPGVTVRNLGQVDHKGQMHDSQLWFSVSQLPTSV